MLLWWWADDRRLGTTARAAIASSDDVAVSVAAVWEIEIKRALGRLVAPDDIVAEVSADGFGLVVIAGPDVVAAAQLPVHHRDPFDRVMVAQAQAADRVLVTADDELGAYDVARLTAS